MPPHTPLPAFAGWSGPHNARTLFVGEAWGREEAEVRKPFVGSSGKELFRMQGEAQPDLAPELHAEIVALHHFGSAWVKRREEWYAAASVAHTNVLAFRPQDNNLANVSLPKPDLPSDYPLSLGPITKTKGQRFLAPEYLHELDRLYDEIRTCQPNLIVALGNTACWALLGTSAISAIRGTICSTQRLPGDQIKLLPTYHPAGVLYQWSWRPIVVADLAKAAREVKSPVISRPQRKVKIFPTLEECRRFMDQMRRTPPRLLACDTETKLGQVTTIGFAPSASECFVIPFWDHTRPGWSYWATAQEEREAWDIVEELLSLAPVVWQNGLYDLQYLGPLGLHLRGDEDTMLLHHSLFPELQKGLGFLGSLYCSEPAWKLMRRRRSTDVVKKDE